MKSISLSTRAGQLQPSPTLAITAKAKAMKARGEDVISLAAGEPDFPTPQPICDAAIDAIRAGYTKYTPTPGIPELRETIAKKLTSENGVSCGGEQVVVSGGAKQSVFNALSVLLNEGDEVILIAPYWMTYADQVRLAGGRPVVVCATAENEFVPLYDDLKAAITSRTRAIIVNSPCNPTGAVFPRETLKEIAALALRHDLWIISDEIYEKLIYGKEHVSVASLGRDVAERTVTVNGCSKTYAMTGWRIGYAAAPLPIASAMSNFQDQVTSNANSIAQRAAIAAFSLDPSVVEGMRSEYEIRRDLVLEQLHGVPSVQACTPCGAFYVMADVTSYLGGLMASDCEIAEYLLEEAKVAVVPGTVFDSSGHIRLSYAASRDDLTNGITRIAEALERLGA